MLSKKTQKDGILAIHPDSVPIQDRRKLLFSMKEILENLAADRYVYESETKRQSVLDHVKELVIQLMISSDDYMKAKTKVSNSNNLIVSSESETEVGPTSDLQDRKNLFRSVIDDYLGEKPSTFHKSMLKGLGGTNPETNPETNPDMEKFARLYLTFDQEFAKRAKIATDPKKAAEARARSTFSRVAHITMRNANSSSILERSFSDCMRSVADRRVVLREIFI